MRFIFQEWDHTEFETQEHLQYFSNFMEYLLEFGEDALKALRDLQDDPEQRKIIDNHVSSTCEQLKSIIQVQCGHIAAMTSIDADQIKFLF